MHFFSQYRGLRRENYVLFFGRIVTNLGAMVWPMLTLILTQKMHMSAKGAALVTIIGGLLMVPANILGGKLADRFSKKMVIVYCDLISIVFYLICGFIPLSMQTIVFICIAATMQSMEDPAYTALIADITPSDQREQAYSLNYLGANLGLVLSPTIAGILFANYLWLTFVLSGVSIACSTVLIFLLVRDIAPVKEESVAAIYQESRERVGVFTVLLENRIVFLYLIAVGLFWAAYSQDGYLLPIAMGETHGAEGALIYGTVFSLNCIVVVVFTPLITQLFRRLTELKKVVVGCILLIISYVAFALFGGVIPMYYIAMLLFTWGEIFATIVDGPYLTKRMPASHRGRINSVRAVIGFTMNGICQFISGQLVDAAGVGTAWAFTLAVATAGLVLVIILVGRDRQAYAELYATPGEMPERKER